MAHTYSQGDEPIPGSGYRLSSFLGRGGFGEVWKATAPGGAEAALKIIRLGGQEGRKEFRALQLVKRIRHPNLVPIIAFWLKGQDGTILDDAFTVQGYLPLRETQASSLHETMVAPPDLGRPQAAELIVAMGLGDFSLFDRLEQCRAQGLAGIPRDELLGYMEDAAEAIDFLNSPVHDLGSGPAAIQHCDIKPHNLMVVGGAAQICDFGLARMMGADRTTSAAATIAYAAPECLQTGEPSASTDQYSLAVTHYELRTGVLPYADETLAAVLDAKQQEKLDFSRLTSAEQAVLRRATLRDPARRFPSAVAMVQALRESVTPALAATRSARARGRRLFSALFLLAGLAGVAFGVWIYIQPPGNQRDGGGDGSGSPHEIGQAERYFRRGCRQLGLKEYDQAIGDFQEAIRLDASDAHGFKKRPEYVAAYLARGLLKSQQQKYGEAIDDLELVRKLTPDDAGAASALGRARLAKNEFQQAVRQFTAALALRPNADDLTARGRAYLQLQRPQEAMADFNEALRLDDNNATAHFCRGRSLLAQKAYNAAATDFEKVILLDPSGDLGNQSRKACAEAYLEQGTTALKKNNYDQAISWFDRASKYDAGNALIFVRRAGGWFGKKDLPKAIQDLTAALKIKENDADYLTRGLAYRQAGDLDKAVADFADAIRLNPQNAAALAHRGDAYLAKFGDSGAAADLSQALADLGRAVQLCRDNPQGNFRLADALLWRAAAYVLAKKYDLAANDFTEIMHSGSQARGNLHVLLDELASGFAQQREWPKAVEWETKAIELAPDEDSKTEYRSRLRQYQAGNL